MSDTTNPGGGEPGHTEMQSALFAQLVMQQTNMAFMLLGKVPHPESGKTARDLEAAQLFIGQLEMLEAKTRGNLNRDEQQLLKQSLMSLHLAFVEAVNAPAPSEIPTPGENKTAPAEAADAAKSDQPGKRFSKSYPG
jgi:hypothetical protein